MLFYTIRLALWIAVACLLIVLIRRSDLKRKRAAYILAVFMAAVLTSISVIFPVENLFVHFDSAERVFSYVGKGDVQAILNGNDSCMVVYSQQGKLDGQLLLPKEGNRYLVPSPSTTMKVSSSNTNQSAFYDVYSVRGTEDYYVFGYFISDSPAIDITDSEGKQLQTTVYPSASPELRYVTFFGVIEDYQADYYIMANGNRVPAE